MMPSQPTQSRPAPPQPEDLSQLTADAVALWQNVKTIQQQFSGLQQQVSALQ
jgi:hypothetical protein